MLGRGAEPRSGWVSAIALCFVVLLGAMLSLRSHFLLRRDRELVDHSFEVIRAADRVFISVLDAETGQRGFVITGKQDFLMPYKQAATDNIPTEIGRLTSLAQDNPQALARIAALKKLTDAKLTELKLTIDTRNAQGFAAAEALVAQRSGKEVMDNIRAATRQIQDSEEQLLTTRLSEVHHDEQRIIALVILTAILSVVARISIVAWRHRMTRRQR